MLMPKDILYSKFSLKALNLSSDTDVHYKKKKLNLKLYSIFLHLSLYICTSRKFRSMSYLIFILFFQELIIMV